MKASKSRTQKAFSWKKSHDGDGHKLRVLTIVDILSRFSPLLQPRFTFRGSDVMAILEGPAREWDSPATIRVDQGSESLSRDLDLPPTHAVSRWTSAAPVSHLTTRSSEPSVAASGPNA
ncbi:hypothetical protein ACNJYD_08600 [Bradyrhizobium sp. DASA03005]|uniref:hypothetical protein n=1 Tax=Bradyrhizobium sp. SPXBL-02 TaxID=3395912 RepID=UPI003F72C1ED